MTIRFFIPSDQDIPTDLRLKADDVHVYYRRLPNVPLAYEFDLYTEDLEKAEAIVYEIARIMCRQSYDHGSEWRVEKWFCTETNNVCQTITVEFRLRDAG